MPRVVQGIEFPDDATPEEIAQFLGSSGGAVQRAPGPSTGSIQYLGAPDEGLEDPGLLDPLNYIPVVPMAQAGLALGSAGVRAAGNAVRGLQGGIKSAANAVMRSKTAPTMRQAVLEAAEGMAAQRSRVPGLQVAGAGLGRSEAALAGGLRQAAPASSTAQGQVAIAEWLARNPGQPVAEVAEQGSKVAGSIKPGSAASRAPKPKPKPKAKAPKKAPEKPGAASSRAETPKGRETPEGVDSRHEVQYYSESKGKYQNIEGMNQVQIERAYNKLAAKDPKKGSLGRRVLEALLEESKHRAKTTGIHVGHA